MADTAPITIDIVSDVVCPWCYVGQKRLERALSSVPAVPVDIRWRPYQLDPSIPPEGRDRKTYLVAKFGSEERIRELHMRLEEVGRAEGIEFAFDAIEVSPNTLDAHRVLRWAATAGPGVQDRLARRLFWLYFEEGADIGDPAVLIEAAREAGMDAALVETLLAAGADREEVRAEIATAQKMGITGVPCFLLEGRYVIVGAQDAAVLANAIRKVSEAKAGGELENATQA